MRAKQLVPGATDQGVANALDAALVQKVPALGSDVLSAGGEVILPDKVRQRSTDTELLWLARRGDSRAFRILVRRHDRYLYRVARSVLLNDQ
jgi:hypothetical protein